MRKLAEPAPRCVHYVGFRDDRYWNAYRIYGGPRIIHRRWDFYATRDVGPDDVVIFAEGDDTQPVADRNATGLDERWLSRPETCHPGGRQGLDAASRNGSDEGVLPT